MLIRLSKLGKRLQGKTAGRKHYAKVCSDLAELQVGNVVFLSFRGVEQVNGSWLNMAVAPLVRWSADQQNDLYPVLAHFPEKDLDELELVAKVNQQCYLVASDDHNPVPFARMVGMLDTSLCDALQRLSDLGEATGAEMHRNIPEAGIQATAWNNRLKELHERRLLFRRKEGRQQVYSPVAKEVELYG